MYTENLGMCHKNSFSIQKKMEEDPPGRRSIWSLSHRPGGNPLPMLLRSASNFATNLLLFGGINASVSFCRESAQVVHSPLASRNAAVCILRTVVHVHVLRPSCITFGRNWTTVPISGYDGNTHQWFVVFTELANFDPTFSGPGTRGIQSISNYSVFLHFSVSQTKMLSFSNQKSVL